MKLKQLKQTNKTMLFSTINGRMDNLKTLLSEEKGVTSISDGLLEKINNTLTVSSFDEFLKKFKPTVYSKFLSDGSLEYSLNPGLDTTGWFAHPINPSNGFLKSIIEVIDGKVGIKSINFNYADCLELLGIKKQADAVDEVGNEFRLLLEKYENAEDESLEQEKYGQLCEEKLQEIVANYNNPLSILPHRIKQLDEVINNRLFDKSSNTDIALIAMDNKITDGTMEFGEDGRARVKGIVDESNDETIAEIIDESENVISDNEHEEENGLALALKETYELYVSENNIPTTGNMGAMLVQAFMPQLLSNNSRKVDDKKSLPALCEEYNDNQKWVNQSLEKFVKEVKSLVEIIVGVKVFFEQAKVKNNKMMPELLVTNCEASALTEELLDPFFVATNHTLGNIDGAIWFAILPNVEMNKNETENKTVKTSGFFKTGKKTVENTLVINKTQVVKTVKILSKYDIQVFISFEDKKNNTFQYISQHGIKEYLEATESLKNNEEINSFIIPCVPNMTIIPENNGIIEKTKRYEAVDEESADVIEENGIRIGAVYIGASFLAAGIITTCQSPSFLSSKNSALKVEPSLPCVRFDIERNSDKIETTIGIEISGYSDEIKSEINSNQFGFVFDSENKTRLRVMTARCLKTDDEDVYEPLFKKTTSTYVKRFLNNSCNGNISKDAVNEFFEGTNKTVFWNKNKSEKFVNALLQDKDEVRYDIDSSKCIITLVLKGIETGLEVEMNNK